MGGNFIEGIDWGGNWLKGNYMWRKLLKREMSREEIIWEGIFFEGIDWGGNW